MLAQEISSEEFMDVEGNIANRLVKRFGIVEATNEISCLLSAVATWARQRGFVQGLERALLLPSENRAEDHRRDEKDNAGDDSQSDLDSQEGAQKLREPDHEEPERNVNVSDAPAGFGDDERLAEIDAARIETSGHDEGPSGIRAYRLFESITRQWVELGDDGYELAEDAGQALTWPTYNSAELVADALHRREEQWHLQVVEGAANLPTGRAIIW